MGYRGGTWNVKVLRHPPLVAAEAAKLMRIHSLSFLLLQEVEGYKTAFMALPDLRYIRKRVKTRNEWREVGILVRDDIRISGVLNTAFGNGWFGNIVGRWHPGRTFLRATLDGWLRVGVIHMPPGVDLATQTPRDQWDDWTALMNAVRGFLLNPRRARLVGGDWNKTANNPMRWSPAYVAKQTGATVAAPNGGHGIDYLLHKRCVVRGIFTDTNTATGSDHYPVIFEVSRSP